MSDGQLVRQTLAGQHQAYEQLVRQWSSRVLAVCHARVHRPDVAEEMAQEALVRAYRALPSLAEPEKFGPWLCGIASRACLDWLKDKDRTMVTFNALGEDASPNDFADRRSLDDDESNQDNIDDLMKEVQKLPEKHREALMLYYYEDKTYQELADLLGVSAATINARLTQARQMLRDRLMKRKSALN